MTLPPAPVLLGLDPLGTVPLDLVSTVRWTPTPESGDRVVIEVHDGVHHLAMRVADERGAASLDDVALDALRGARFLLSVSRWREERLLDGDGELLVRLVADARYVVSNVSASRGLTGPQSGPNWLPTDPAVLVAGSVATLRVPAPEGAWTAPDLTVSASPGLLATGLVVEPGAAFLHFDVAVDPAAPPGDAFFTIASGHDRWVARTELVGLLADAATCESALATPPLADGGWRSSALLLDGALDLPCGDAGAVEGPIRWARVQVGRGEALQMDAWDPDGRDVGVLVLDGCDGAALACTAATAPGYELVQVEAGDAREFLVGVATLGAPAVGTLDWGLRRWLDADLRLTPDHVHAGEQRTLRLESPWLDLLVDTGLDLGPDIEVTDTRLAGLGVLDVDVTVAASAGMGPRDLLVDVEDESFVLEDALRVDGRVTLPGDCLGADLVGPLAPGRWQGSTGNLTNAHGGEGSCVIGATDGPDGVIRLPDAVAGQRLSITIESAFDASLSLLGTCAGSPTVCVDDVGDGDVETLILDPEDWLDGPWYLRIDGRDGGVFQLDLEVAP